MKSDGLRVTDLPTLGDGTQTGQPLQDGIAELVFGQFPHYASEIGRVDVPRLFLVEVVERLSESFSLL